jgi:hypothetical protein
MIALAKNSSPSLVGNIKRYRYSGPFCFVSRYIAVKFHDRFSFFNGVLFAIVQRSEIIAAELQSSLKSNTDLFDTTTGGAWINRGARPDATLQCLANYRAFHLETSQVIIASCATRAR